MSQDRQGNNPYARAPFGTRIKNVFTGVGGWIKNHIVASICIGVGVGVAITGVCHVTGYFNDRKDMKNELNDIINNNIGKYATSIDDDGNALDENSTIIENESVRVTISKTEDKLTGKKGLNNTIAGVDVAELTDSTAKTSFEQVKNAVGVVATDDKEATGYNKAIIEAKEETDDIIKAAQDILDGNTKLNRSNVEEVKGKLNTLTGNLKLLNNNIENAKVNLGIALGGIVGEVQGELDKVQEELDGMTKTEIDKIEISEDQVAEFKKFFGNGLKNIQSFESFSCNGDKVNLFFKGIGNVGDDAIYVISFDVKNKVAEPDTQTVLSWIDNGVKNENVTTLVSRDSENAGVATRIDQAVSSKKGVEQGSVFYAVSNEGNHQKVTLVYKDKDGNFVIDEGNTSAQTIEDSIVESWDISLPSEEAEIQ